MPEKNIVAGYKINHGQFAGIIVHIPQCILLDEVVSHVADLISAINNIIDSESVSKVGFRNQAIAVIFEMVIGRREAGYNDILQQYFFDRLWCWRRSRVVGEMVFSAGGEEQHKSRDS